MAKSTLQLVCDIISTVLKLKPDQVWIYNQRTAIPEDKRLYIVVGLISSQPYANNKRFDGDTLDKQFENITTNVQETLSIDLFSYTTEAIEKYASVMAALRSTYSQQVQELNALKIAEIPVSINDVSEVEGAARLNRVSITLQCLRKYDTIFENEFYDDFSLELYNEAGQVI